jgi:hypothetical protein
MHKKYFEQIPVAVVKRISQEQVLRRSKRAEIMRTSPDETPTPTSRGFLESDLEMEASTQMEHDGLQYPHWQKPYQEALVELDKGKLKERVAAAEAAILDRLQVISSSSDQVAERHAIKDALAMLRFVRQTELSD